VFSENEEVGLVTSGTMAPFLKKSIAMAFLRVDKAKIGTSVEVQIRSELVPAKVVSKCSTSEGKRCEVRSAYQRRSQNHA